MKIEKRPRGRPRKERAPEPPARRVGRPDLPLRDDPARYAVALVYALGGFDITDREASRLVAACFYGYQDEMIDLEGIKDKLHKRLKSKGQEDHGLFQFTGRGTSPPLESKADSLRKKARGPWGPEESAWLASMGLAFMACLGAVDLSTGKHAAMAAADAAGEKAYCEAVLFPMIEAKFSG